MLRFALFIGVFLLIWISLQPFADLGDPPPSMSRTGRGLTYALFGLLAVLSLALVMRRHAEALRSFLTTPYILFGCWMCINLLMSRDPGASMLRFSLTASCLCGRGNRAAVAGNRARTERLARRRRPDVPGGLLSRGPDDAGSAIHQATDAAEYHLAGDWRGVFLTRTRRPRSW